MHIYIIKRETHIASVKKQININVIPSNYSGKRNHEKLCNKYMWEATPMWILDVICNFASTSENGAHMLCFKKSKVKWRKKEKSKVSIKYFHIKSNQNCHKWKM